MEVRGLIVIAEKWFQLGNRLFAMGHFIGAAVAGGFKIVNPAFADYAAYFESTRYDLWCRFPALSEGRRTWAAQSRWPARRLEPLAQRLSGLLQKHHLNNRLVRAVTVGLQDEFRLDRPDFQRWARRTCFLMVHGWSFRDPERFESHADVIRHHFTPIAELREQVWQVSATARAQCEILVGVHIRHGDYLVHLDGKYYYETALYAAWMKQIVALFPGQRVGFLVCSNAPQDPAQFAGLNWMPGAGQLVVDMYSLAACDRIIGPPSTFSQWASFYGQRPLCIVRERNMMPVLDSFVVFNAHMSHT